MTNAQIIFSEEQRLAKEGLIKYTGNEIVVQNDAGSLVTIKETEPLHTFAHWKALGFIVKKGEKAVTKTKLWKYKTNKDKETGEEESHMYMFTSALFSESQVEALA